MNLKLKENLIRSFQLTHDLVMHLDETALTLDLPHLPSNRIAGQLWCMVGARESYLEAIESGGWKGFACSLKAPKVKSSVLAALEATQRQSSELVFSDVSGVQVGLAFDLLEHEVQHHGQLIRFVYANRLSFPKSWNTRYTV